MRRIFSGTSIAVCAFVAATAVSADSSHIPSDPNRFHSLIGAVSSEAAAYDYAFNENENADLLNAQGSHPSDALLAQESDAAALYTGRNFFALGKPRDQRADFTRIAAGAVETPEGWRRGFRGDDERLVHSESGLECPLAYDLSVDDKNRVLALTGVTKYDQRGRDVSCNYAVAGEAAITVYASFYPDLSLEDHAGGAVAAIRQNFRIMGILPVITVEIKQEGEADPNEDLPPTLSGAFDVGEVNGVPYKTAIWLGKTHGWHVKTRATFPQSDLISEITAAVLFRTNFLNVDKKNRANPTADGAEV